MNVLVHKIVKLCKPVKRLEWWGFALSHSLMEYRLTGPSSSSPWPFTLWFSAFAIFNMYASCLWAGGRKEADWCGDRSLTPVGTDPQRAVWHPGATQPAARGLLKPNTSLHCPKNPNFFLLNQNKVWADARNQGQVRFWVPQMHLQQINCHIDWLSPELHLCPVFTVKEDNCYEGVEIQRLCSQQDPGWSNEDNWGRGHSRDDDPLKDTCLCLKGQDTSREYKREQKRRKLVREICLCKRTHVTVFSVFSWPSCRIHFLCPF